MGLFGALRRFCRRKATDVGTWDRQWDQPTIYQEELPPPVLEKKRQAEEEGCKCYYGLYDGYANDRWRALAPQTEDRVDGVILDYRLLLDEADPIEIHEAVQDRRLLESRFWPHRVRTLEDFKKSDEVYKFRLVTQEEWLARRTKPSFDPPLFVPKPSYWESPILRQAQLAANILDDVFGRTVFSRKTAEEHFRSFLEEVVLGLPESDWAITESEVRQWMLGRSPDWFGSEQRADGGAKD